MRAGPVDATRPSAALESDPVSGFGPKEAPVLMPPEATKADVEAHFATHGTGEITEIKLMNGFGFIEYKDAMDARDVVPGKFSSPALGFPVLSCLEIPQIADNSVFLSSLPYVMDPQRTTPLSLK